MWIKAAYCTKDTVYAKRLSAYFDKEYGNKIELNICTSIASLFDFGRQYQIDIVLFGDEFEEEASGKRKDIPCACAFLVEQVYEMADTASQGLPKIDKFQKADNIYKEILDAYTAGGKVKHIRTGETGKTEQKIYVFVSPAGGSGTTTVARAYARKCAAYEKILYLDFGLFGDTGITEGNVNGMDEIILALKSRRNILPLKLASAVSNMADNVFTYGSCKDTLALLELDAEDAVHLITGISALSEYQKIIIDIGSRISYKEIAFMKNADFIVCVVEESNIAEKKYEKFCEFLEHAGAKEQMRLIRKMLVFKNKVKQDYNNDSWKSQNEVIGWAPYVQAESYDAVIDRIARSDSFSSLEMRNVQ